MKPKKEIIIVFNTMIEHPSGGDTRIIELCKRFQENFQVKVILSADSARYFNKEKIDKIVCKKTLKFKNFLGYTGGIIFTYLIRAIQALFFIPKLKKNLIFYAPSDLLVDVLPVVVGKVINKHSTIVQVIHHLIPSWHVRGEGKLKNFLSFYFQRFSHYLIKNNASIIFVVNSLMKKELIKKGFKNHIEVIGNGIDKNGILKVFNSVDVGKEYQGVFIGRLQYSKGVMDLIEIWNLVVKKNPKAKLVIIGNALPEVSRKMEKRIKQYGLARNIKFLKYLPRRDLIITLKKSKLFIYPTHEEGWGIAAAEAMICKLPVIAYDLPVFREIFPKGMVKHELNNLNTFVESINELLNNDIIYNKISMEAFSLAKNYSWDNIAKREIDYIERF